MERRSPASVRTVLCLAALTGWYLAATLPRLADFPLLDWPQMGIVAPAFKLAEEGVYGNDLFAGFHRSELRNYEYMPAYPLLVALSFAILGPGVFEARLVSVLCGWLTVLLTWFLGRRLYGPAAGLVAAALLCTLRLGLLPETSGIPLLDFARVIRYDVLVPVGVLASAICFLWAAGKSGGSAGFLAAGALAGLATLAHLYGAFILAVFGAVLLWQRGARVLREAPLYLLAAGWLLALSPWIAYVLQDPEAYLGQMSRHAARFDLLDPAFYWNNLRREPWRYAPWLRGGFPATLLRPRVGIWLLLLGGPAAMVLLWRRVRDQGRLHDRFLLLSLPVLGLCLAFLMLLKRNAYTVLVLPFIALWLGFLAAEAWRRAGTAAARRSWRGALAVLGVLALAEGGLGVSRSLAAARQASPYLELCQKIARTIRPGSRVLLTQHYWLGLKEADDFELRSIHLVFLLADPMSVEAAMERLAPDYVVIESFLLEERPTDPRGPRPGSEAKRTFLEIGAYLARHCSGETARYPDPDYGAVEVHRCR